MLPYYPGEYERKDLALLHGRDRRLKVTPTNALKQNSVGLVERDQFDIGTDGRTGVEKSGVA